MGGSGVGLAAGTLVAEGVAVGFGAKILQASAAMTSTDSAIHGFEYGRTGMDETPVSPGGPAKGAKH
jgi:hypothetical protein